MNKLLTALSLVIIMSSCQKEVDFDDPLQPNGGTPSGTSNGDILVKALEITIQTKDTNTLPFQWDNAKRLLQYYSLGKVNGTRTLVA